MWRQKPRRKKDDFNQKNKAKKATPAEETRPDILAILERQRAARAAEEAHKPINQPPVDTTSSSTTVPANTPTVPSSGTTASSVAEPSHSSKAQRTRKRRLGGDVCPVTEQKSKLHPVLRLLRQRETRGRVAQRWLASALAPSHFSARAVECSPTSGYPSSQASRPFCVSGSGETSLQVAGICSHETLPLVLVTFKGVARAYIFRAVREEGNVHTMQPNAWTLEVKTSHTSDRDPGEPCLWLGGNHSTVAAVVGFAGGAGVHGEASVFFFDLSTTASHHRFVFRSDMSGTLHAIAARPLIQPTNEQTLVGIELVTAGDSGEPIRAIHVPRSTSHLRGLHNKFQVAVNCGLAPCDIFSLAFAPESWGPSWSEDSEKAYNCRRPVILAGGRGGRVFAVCHQGIAPVGALVDMRATESARGKGSRHYWQGRGPIVRFDLLEQHPGLALGTVWAQGAYLLDFGLVPNLKFSSARAQALSFAHACKSGSSSTGRGGKRGRSGKGNESHRKGVGITVNPSHLKDLKVIRTFPDFTPSRLSVDRHASTIMVTSLDGATCRLFAALSGACLYEGPASTAGGQLARIAPAPQLQPAKQPRSACTPNVEIADQRDGFGDSWWSSAWWSAHEHEDKVSFSRAGFSL